MSKKKKAALFLDFTKQKFAVEGKKSESFHETLQRLNGRFEREGETETEIVTKH